MARTYSKEDVEFHSDGYRESRPAVNVKVDTYLRRVELPLCLGGVSEKAGDPIRWIYTDDGFTHDWIEENVSEESMMAYFGFACESGWEQLQQIAEETFGLGVKVYSEGRSGGWAVVDGIPEFDSWDAIDLGRWRKFERLARLIASDVPRSMVDMIYANVWEPAREELLGNLH